MSRRWFLLLLFFSNRKMPNKLANSQRKMSRPPVGQMALAFVGGELVLFFKSLRDDECCKGLLRWPFCLSEITSKWVLLLGFCCALSSLSFLYFLLSYSLVSYLTRYYISHGPQILTLHTRSHACVKTCENCRLSHSVLRVAGCKISGQRCHWFCLRVYYIFKNWFHRNLRKIHESSFTKPNQVSSVENPGWLFDIGDEILPNYMGIIS